ncbi:MAG: glycoside hydrolase family 2 TIM barrel-domain containing protein [Nakamurella sp.]
MNASLGPSPEDPHPRPQLVRGGWTDLSGEWEFRHDDDEIGLGQGWQRGGTAFDQTIVVPYPPESSLSGIHATGHHPVVWYRRRFTPPAGRRVLLHLGAVDYRASVWVNGHLVATHEGGHTPFSADITTALTSAHVDPDGEPAVQTVVVRAEDRPGDATQPRGKQDWAEPHVIWYHRTTGIWQTVWLEGVPDLHVTDLTWTPDIPGAAARMEIDLNRLPATAVTVRVVLRLGTDEVLADQSWRVTTDRAALQVDIPALAQGQDRDRLLWSPESPTLIRAVVTVSEPDGPEIDRVRSYLGLRSAGIGGGHFLLNGQPYFLRMVLNQGYWPDSHLAAPGPDGLRKEAELIKAFGFNGVRVHQKIEDPRFLYWCDVLGLLVWAEMPSAYEFSATAVERLVHEWVAAVRRDRSHPCVVTWVPLNESWGVQDIAVSSRQQHYATALYHLTHALDGSRPVISNDGWEHTESDIWSIHDYAPTGDVLAQRYGTPDGVAAALHHLGTTRRNVLLGDPVHRGQPVMITEFGGLSYAPEAPGDSWFGYATVADAEDLYTRVAGLIGALLDSPQIAGFCYTQLADTEQEANGLLTAARCPKIDPPRFRAMITRASAGIGAEQVDAERAIAIADPVAEFTAIRAARPDRETASR